MDDKKANNLIRLRNELCNTSLGTVLLEYLQDIITDEACKVNKNAENIKGMCEIVQRIKDIPQRVENIRSN